MGICSWIIFGFFAGLIARALMPGRQAMGFIRTTLLGVAGAFLGGFASSLLQGTDPMVLRPAGFIGAVIGAIVVLMIGAFMGGSRR